MKKRFTTILSAIALCCAAATASETVPADVVEVYNYIIKVIGDIDVNVGDWNNGGTIDGGEAEE